MKIAVFQNLLDAAIYRRNHGGWMFVSHGDTYWFDASEYTPSAIMAHRLTRGLSGELICDNRYIKAA